MKKIKRIILFLLGLVILFSAYALLSGRTYLFKAVVYNLANIDDYKKFSNHTVGIAKPQPWKVSANYNKLNFPDTLSSYLEGLVSVGLLMLRNDSIVFEKYWDGYRCTPLNS